MRRTFAFVLTFLQIFIFVNANGFYTIVAPGTLQSNNDYLVSVTLHENSEPAIIKIKIEGPSYSEEKTINISPATTELAEFAIPQLKDAAYQLISEGIQGLIFKNSTKLHFRNRTPKVYIQTDKAVYKPGDLVQYRLVVLDENTRPAKLDQPMKLDFKDGAGNIVKQVKDVKLNKGVYTGDFQLSEQPVLGDWMMQAYLGAKYDETRTDKKFEVARYVLPKFSINIETASAITYSDPLKITVRAKYTYGKPVKGKATVTVTIANKSNKVEKSVDVDGKGLVEIDLEKDLKLKIPKESEGYGYYTYTPSLNILAIMTEEYTGSKQNKSAVVHLQRSRYNIEVPYNVYEFTANKPFEMHVIVKNIDGSPVQDAKESAKLTIDKNGDKKEFTSKPDNNGMAVFKVTLPTDDYYNTVKVQYADYTRYLPSLRGKKPSEEMANDDIGPLKLVMTTDVPLLNQDVAVDVKSNKDMSYYMYAIVARGNIIKQELVKLPANTKSHEIKFKPTFDMVPTTHLYVYFVRDGDLVFQEKTITFPKEFQNKIEITAPKQAKPSEEVTLNVKTDPESFVGLLGVDQSVLLLQSGNDLDSNKILDDLGTYDSTSPIVGGNYPGRVSGLLTQTNANYPFVARRRSKARGRFKVVLNFCSVIRKNFIETWIMENINNTDKNGVATVKKNIPDTITSWVVTGFSMNDKTGFGIVANPTSIQVFQPFFVSISLPYSVKRGEVISIPVVAFNYMDKALDAEITMENTDAEYDFTEASNEIDEVVVQDKERVKEVSIPSNSGQSVSFMIRPNKVGEISLKVKATSPLAGDAVDQKLKVEPEGVTHYENGALFLNPPIKETIKAVIPADAVLDSEYLEFSAVSDVLGPTIKNIDNLVRKPDGCGEQNMVNFVPNILILHYLDAIKRDMPAVVERAKKYMEIGYQRELTYKHKNGAYSAFGEGSSEPNSWLTAYVARSFIQAKKYISIDADVINQALEYVVSNQLPSGQFKQTGRLFHPSHQNDMGFTAFALLALLEDEDYSSKYKSQIDKGTNYLADNIDKESDTYALGIAIAALKKAQNPSASKLMEKLEKIAHDENGLKWWTKSKKDHSNNVEITAYVLQAYVTTEDLGKITPILKWLITKRNNMGGFDSTQDTVVGLQALIAFSAKHIKGGEAKMTIKFEAQDGNGKQTTKGSFTLDKENTLILQTHVLPKTTRQVIMDADGEGSSLVQLSYRYNLATAGDKPGFNIKHKMLSTSHPTLMEMEVCASFVPGANSDAKESNMAIMEINLPSGFTVDTDKLDDIRQVQQIQRVETKNSETSIIVYFDYLASDKEVCPKVNAVKSHAVAKQKPAAITMYDYYNSEQRATVYYEVKSSLCDICEQNDCGKGCGTK